MRLPNIMLTMTAANISKIAPSTIKPTTAHQCERCGQRNHPGTATAIIIADGIWIETATARTVYVLWSTLSDAVAAGTLTGEYISLREGPTRLKLLGDGLHDAAFNPCWTRV